MDGSGYPLWPEKPKQGADDDSDVRRSAKVALVVLLALFVGCFLSMSREGLSRSNDCVIDGRSTVCR